MSTTGEVPGGGLPDWPEDLETFRERQAYQRGVADARRVDRAQTRHTFLGVLPVDVNTIDRLDEAAGRLKEQVNRERVRVEQFSLGWRLAQAVIALHELKHAEHTAAVAVAVAKNNVREARKNLMRHLRNRDGGP